MEKLKLIRQQMDRTLDKFRVLLDISPPPKGWIRAIRNSLGMSSRQLAARMGVSRQWAFQLEKQETTGTATLNSLKKTAEHLDCIFIYALVPRTSLEQTVRDQAEKIASKQLNRAAHTMNLEAQGLEKEENRAILENMIDELINNQPSYFWNSGNEG